MATSRVLDNPGQAPPAVAGDANSLFSAEALREVELLLDELTDLRVAMIERAASLADPGQRLHSSFQASARNLLHYLALRDRDLRPLQQRLAAFGLSSLGRAESHVLATVEAVVRVLHGLAGRAWDAASSAAPLVDFATGQQLLADHTEAVLGPPSPSRHVHIMVTMPSEAADDYSLIHNLIRQGMTVMRVNCAHDDAGAWGRMIAHARRAEQALGVTCRVLMDLGGPKLRTGPVAPAPPVIKVRPERDPFGRVVTAARIWLTDEDRPTPPPTPAAATLPVSGVWLAKLRTGDRLTCVDTREARRTLCVAEATASGCWLETERTVYFAPGVVLQRKGSQHRHRHEAIIGPFAPREQALRLSPGDELVLTRELALGRPATRDAGGNVTQPAQIGCTLPQIFADVRPGESIWLDDGQIGGVIERATEAALHVRITQTPARGGRLRGDKGINLPQSELRLPALTDKDLRDLEFVAGHADLVGLSFVNEPADVERLQAHLERLGGERLGGERLGGERLGGQRLGAVLKIETRRGFENLPALLLAAMRFERAGVMIARGDLAVECGFERLAEVQEEILWICEAAHFPVVWATQVLENLAKEGKPSRAEITDAAMSNRAECVMLNKGPHILAAVQALDDILRRMEAHQDKKQSMLRQLRLAKPAGNP
ncbi:MAG: pyruvate kinase [Gemmataceae bacterium]|nr:pyruvate kinase [Gemmataceae bacterium]